MLVKKEQHKNLGTLPPPLPPSRVYTTVDEATDVRATGLRNDCKNLECVPPDPMQDVCVPFVHLMPEYPPAFLHASEISFPNIDVAHRVVCEIHTMILQRQVIQVHIARRHSLRAGREIPSAAVQKTPLLSSSEKEGTAMESPADHQVILLRRT